MANQLLLVATSDCRKAITLGQVHFDRQCAMYSGAPLFQLENTSVFNIL